MKWGDVWRHFFRTWSQHTVLQVTSLFVLSGVFIVIVLFLLFYQNFETVLKNWGESFHINVYVEPSISTERVQELKREISSRKEVKKVRFISSKEALKAFTSNLLSKEGRTFFSDFKLQNPLPQSFEVHIKRELLGPKQDQVLKTLNEDISKLKGISEVSYGKFILKNYMVLVRGFYKFSLVFIFLFLIGSLLIIGNAIKSSLNQRREEIQVLRMMGSTSLEVKCPFVIEGALMGFLSSVLALFICYSLFSFQLYLFREEIQFLILGVELKYLNVISILLVLFLGGAFGTLGSLTCFQRRQKDFGLC